MPASKRRAVFLDRDGVINEILFHREMGIIETPFTVAQFKLKQGTGRALRRINRLGLMTVVASNQPGVAMRHFSQKTLNQITEKMRRDLKKEGAQLDAVYYCVHHPTKGKGALKRRCGCRKPKPGLLLQAARGLAIDLKKSFVIGDSILDVMAGKRAGCTTFLLAHLKCDLCHLMAQRGLRPDHLVKDLGEAVKKIARLTRKRPPDARQ